MSCARFRFRCLLLLLLLSQLLFELIFVDLEENEGGSKDCEVEEAIAEEGVAPGAVLEQGRKEMHIYIIYLTPPI
jgi:hypothetical protein